MTTGFNGPGDGSFRKMRTMFSVCDIRPHDLRHSFCEWCISNGMDLKTVCSWMGHSDQKMIMTVYDHVTATRELKAVEKLNKIFQEDKIDD